VGSNRRSGASCPQLVVPVAHHELEIPESAPLNDLDRLDRRIEKTEEEEKRERAVRLVRNRYGNQYDDVLPKDLLPPTKRPAEEMIEGDVQSVRASPPPSTKRPAADSEQRERAVRWLRNRCGNQYDDLLPKDLLPPTKTPAVETSGDKQNPH
jgi:hypothetical protein